MPLLINTDEDSEEDRFRRLQKKRKKEPAEYHATEDIRTRRMHWPSTGAGQLVLPSASEPLQKKLLGNHSEAKNSIVRFPADDPAHLRLLLEYIYCGRLSVTPSPMFVVFAIARASCCHARAPLLQSHQSVHDPRKHLYYL